MNNVEEAVTSLESYVTAYEGRSGSGECIAVPVCDLRVVLKVVKYQQSVMEEYNRRIISKAKSRTWPCEETS